jgi:RNA-directed DNA polymerase
MKTCRPGISPEEEEFVTKALFVDYNPGRTGLAVGAPSSPKASNAVMWTIDASLTGYAVSRQACYTRYADDLVFSTNSRGESRKFVDEVENLLSRTPSPALRVNRRKTIYASPTTRHAVTGLVITPKHAISIGRHNKRHVRKLLFDLSRNALDGERLQYLKGYLAFVENVEPDFLNKMALRYGAGLLALARQGRAPA